MEKIIIATTNKNKLAEYREMLVRFEILGLDGFNVPEVEETGKTFIENARLKAHVIANKIDLPVIADDSGLVVEALNGEPGVYSARYAGDHDEAKNNEKLLAKLRNEQNREAYYNTTLVLAKPHQDLDLIVEGVVRGRIIDTPRGENGFGYDPYFYYAPFNKTFGELSMHEKNQVSQRKRAIEKMIPQINKFLK